VHLTEGEAIILEVVQVTSRSRITHVGKFALMFMNAVVKQICWDFAVEHEVSMEKPTSGNRGGQPV
jgi:hypothetical protein